MIAFSSLPPPTISSGRHLATTTLQMSLAATSSFSSLASISIATTSSSAASAASTAAAVTPLSSWASSVSNSRLWVGSAWIISSAILTTYSTTKFLKYQGEKNTLPHSTSSEGDNSKTFRQFSSILNSTQKHDQKQQILEKPQKGVRRATNISRASLLTLYRFSGSLLLGLLIHSHFYQLSRLLPRFLKTVQVAQQFLLPSIFLFIANYSNSIALDRIGISLTYTSKCGIPLITVLFTLLLDGTAALPSNATLFSLLPIAIGIGAASWNSPTFELFGFLAAMVSTTSQAALNVVSKRVMRKTGIKGVEAQRAMVFVALGIGLVMTMANSIGGHLRELQQYGTNVRNLATADEEGGQDLPSTKTSSHPPLWLTCLAVLAYHMEYVLSFSFVGLVEPITYGTCDALRRLLIIVMGRQLFGGDKFSKANLGGIFMALLGALLYSITSAGG
eukprot:CAMPEP_0181118814 /NCGR_PEP_ID=MMETSP1071-20121207/23278_1 /TAXON_ID=35127 /ORGANISM="Thalassiosira sp., Strain NH16" /LENGTH=446 /DNA_ID=CAMNT_0023203337 /DNA_START=239 /DNA_END=1576 /DNA_ORIENTATION=-